MSLQLMKRHIRTMLNKFYIPNCLEVGIDEAGRGPMFGRVYVGAAILPPDDSFDHSLMRDSKKLSVKKRLYAYEYIKNNAIAWTSSWISEEEIENIHGLDAVASQICCFPKKICN